MRSVNDCVAVAEALSAEDRDLVLARVDTLRADGIGPAEAGRTAAQDLLAETEAELAEFLALVREQHPATFETPAKPAAPPRSRYFTNPSEYTGEPDLRFSSSQPKGKVSPASVVEKSVADGAARIAEYIRRGGVRQSVQVGLGGTPHVLRMLGYPRNGLVVDNSILDKVFLGKHKDETRKLTPRGLMEALHQPAAVWRSGQDLLLMLPLQGTEGAPIVAPLRVEGPNAQVKSIYELNPPEQAVSNLASALQKGGVLYADIAGAERALQSKSPLSGAVAAGGLRSSGAGTAAGQAGPEVTPPGSNLPPSMLGVEVSRQSPQQAAPLTRAPDRLGTGSRARIFEQLRQAVNVGTVKGRGDLTTWIASNYIGPGEEMPRFSRAQTETPEFKAWFGNSKVVDAYGKPLVVYHGSDADFYEFKYGEEGFHFGTREQASAMGGVVRPFYLSARNLFRFDTDLQNWNDIEGVSDYLLSKRKITGAERQDFPGLQEWLDLKGYDGYSYPNNYEGGGLSYAVLRPEQIKSAIGNRGTFDPANPDVRYARAQGRFTLPEFDKFDQGIEQLQDRYNRWKQVVNAVREQGGSVDEINNFYLAEERYWGRTGAAIEDFQKEVADWVEALAADKLTVADMATYAYAKHARERNEYIASIRPDMPDGGSGMSTADAQAYLDDAQQSGLQPLFDKHADKLYEWIQGTRDVLYEGGLLSEEEWLNWSSMFQNYVPLRGLAGREEARGTGQGFTIRGKEGKHALGRFSEAANLIENILQDRARAYIRVGKNDVLKSFAKFVLDNPDPKLWQINAVENKPVMTVDANGDRIVEVKPTLVDDDKRTVTLKDAGQEIHILINDPALREQMKNLHQKDLPGFIGALLWTNRQMARMYTSLNPVFVMLNAARDVQAATVGMLDEVGFAGAGRMWKRLPGAVAEAARAEFGTPSADYQLFRATGGKTGFFIFGDVDQRASELSSMLADANRSALNPIKLARQVLRFVESVNAVIENATRFATWRAARESGKSVAEASSISKNITVNFNRKGTAANAISAWFLFFNPAVQGTARMLQALRSPKVLAVLGAGMTAAAAIAMRNADMGEDDDGVPWWDKIPDEVKERNLVFVLPPGSTQGEGIPGSPQGRYIKVPMPYGYNFFAVLANQVADVMRNMRDPNHGRTAIAGSAQALNAFLGSWLPTPELGRAITTEDDASAGKSLALFATPDAASPLMQVALNQNAFGRKLFPDDPSSRNLPDSARYFTGQEGTVYQRGTEALNRLSGGGAFRSSFFDFSPATIENIVRGYGGGPASFIMDSLNVAYARQSIERPEWEWRRAPFAKQLYGVIDDETDRMAGYERMRKAEAVLGPLQKAKAARNFEEVRAIRDEHPALSHLGKDLRNVQEKLTALRKQELAVLRNDEISDPEKYARMQKLNARRRAALNLFTKRFDSLTQAQANKEDEEETVAQP